MRLKIGEEAYKKRLKKLADARKEAIKNVDKLHVKLQKGNRKTGTQVWTVSLLPIIDCQNCSKCSRECYDFKADMIYKQTINDRARNSAIHLKDRNRFWYEIDMQIKANFVTHLRLNVGGDYDLEDFKHVWMLAINNTKTEFLFFTKNYKDINEFYKKYKFPNNVHVIISDWEGMKDIVKKNLPRAHVLYEDGRTTAPEYGAYFCKGNCTECAFNGEGCWTLKENEHVIFRAH